MKKIIPVLVILYSLVSYLFVRQEAQAGSAENKISSQLQSQLDTLSPGQMITVIVTLQAQYQPDSRALENIPDRQRIVIEGLQVLARNQQAGVTALLAAEQAQGRVARYIPFWVFNGISVTAVSAVIQELANRPEVASITPDATDIIPVGTVAQAAPSDNLAAIHVLELWNLGDYGQGVVVASMDTGVDFKSPRAGLTLARGGSDSG